MPRRSEKCVTEGSKYPHWIGLYLSFHLTWVLGPFVHGRLHNMQTSEDTFAHAITLLNSIYCHVSLNHSEYNDQCLISCRPFVTRIRHILSLVR